MSATGNRAALITGANRGIGLELTRQLIDHGYFVFMGVRDKEKGERALKSLPAPERATVLKLDVSDSSTFSSAVEVIRQSGYSLNILVNNAGVMMDGDIMQDSTTSISADRLRSTFDTNFFGVVALTNAVLPVLMKAEKASILNISSDMGSLQLHARQHPLAKTFAYNASKAALNMFTIHLANALKGENIQVNAVHPGWVKTDMGSEYAPLEVHEAVAPVIDFLLNDEVSTGRFVFKGQEVDW